METEVQAQSNFLHWFAVRFQQADDETKIQVAAIVSNWAPDNRSLRTRAKDILIFLNHKTHHNFRPVAANLDMIMNRLKEGATASDCKQVIAMKTRAWRGTDMAGYLRPATLFNRTKFWQYHGELQP